MTTLSSTLTALTTISADNYQWPEESGPRSMTIVRLLNMTAGGILRWALWRGVAFLREMVNVAAASTCVPTANTSHQAQASPHAISRPYQIWSNIQRLRIWEFLERVQLLAIHGTRPRQCLREEVGYLVGIVGYCLANAGCLG